MTLHLFRPLLALLLVAATAASLEPQPSPTPAADPALRARLLDFGGALANEGFRLRDGFWAGRLESGKSKRLAVNLFAGNQYWFCAATGSATQPRVVLYDPQGAVVPVLAHEGEGLAAVGVTAAVTGRYIVEVAGARGPASDFCLLYLFK
ncbi:MAG: hypothetical protein WEC73_04925 [Chthoniobacterales bacterium]